MSSSDKTVSIAELASTSGVGFGTSGVRGLVAHLSDDLCYAYTLAFLQTVGVSPGSKVALAMDLRPSSPRIASACAAAISAAGMQVDFCGAVPTPALAYYAQQNGMAGIMVTGSHIPFDRNGIKFYGLHGEISKADEMYISSATVSLTRASNTADLPEANLAARTMYIYRYLDFFPPRCLAGMKLAVYEHSSVARDVLKDILQILGAEIISLGRTNDFVPIDTEAVTPDDIVRAKKWAKDFRFDAILSADGDGDRPLIGDEEGRWMRGDIVGLLCAKYLSVDYLATPVSCNSAIERSCYFSVVKRTRIGSPYVIEAMLRMIDGEGEVVAGFEANGGFLLGSFLRKHSGILAPLMTRDAVLPMLSLLAMTRDRSTKLSRLTNTLPDRFTASDRLQEIPSSVSRELLGELASSMSSIAEMLKSLKAIPVSLDQTDGLRITMDNEEIVHFRPSGNAPELRCYAEAASQERANWVCAEALRLIRDRAGLARHTSDVATEGEQ